MTNCQLRQLLPFQRTASSAHGRNLSAPCHVARASCTDNEALHLKSRTVGHLVTAACPKLFHARSQYALDLANGGLGTIGPLVTNAMGNASAIAKSSACQMQAALLVKTVPPKKLADARAVVMKHIIANGAIGMTWAIVQSLVAKAQYDECAIFSRSWSLAKLIHASLTSCSRRKACWQRQATACRTWQLPSPAELC